MGNLNGQIYVLQQRASRLTRGDELCDHHWNNTDGCFETYCTGCDTHIGEERSENDIPFKDCLVYKVIASKHHIKYATLLRWKNNKTIL